MENITNENKQDCMKSGKFALTMASVVEIPLMLLLALILKNQEPYC